MPQFPFLERGLAMGSTRYFAALPPELRRLFCFFMPLEVLHRCSDPSEDSLAKWSEFRVLKTEPFWRAVYRRLYSAFEYSDVYPVKELSWREHCRHLMAVTLNSSVFEQLRLFVRFGCEIACNWLFQVQLQAGEGEIAHLNWHFGEILSEAGYGANIHVLQLLEREMLGGQYALGANEVRVIFDRRNLTGWHARERVALIGYIWQKFASRSVLVAMIPAIAMYFTVSDFEEHVAPSISRHRQVLSGLIIRCAVPKVSNAPLFRHLAGVAESVGVKIDYTSVVEIATCLEIVGHCYARGAICKANRFRVLEDASEDEATADGEN